jgi:hypothetical protein
MKTLNNYPKLILGKGTYSDSEVWLNPPKWELNWYWSFGVLQNKECSYHIETIQKEQNLDLKTAIDLHLKESFIIKNDSDKWKFAELISTFYVMKKYAELLYIGGSHYTGNPCCETIKNREEWERINNVVLPKIFEEIYKILLKEN